MARLKFELNKYPSSHKKRTQTASTTTNSGKKLTFPYDEDSSPVKNMLSPPISSNTHEIKDSPETPTHRSPSEPISRTASSKKLHEDIEIESAKKTFATTKNRARNLLEDYGLYKEEPVLSPNKKTTAQKRENVNSAESRKDKRSEPATKQITAKTIPKEEIKEYKKLNNYMNEKPKQKIEKKSDHEHKKKELNDSVRNALADCQNEIGELKEIVLHSKRSIYPQF